VRLVGDARWMKDDGRVGALRGYGGIDLAILNCHDCGKYSVHARYCQKITIQVAAHDQPDYCGKRRSVACWST